MAGAQETAPAERLDQYVVRQLPKLSRSAATRLIANGKVTVNGEAAGKAGHKIRPGDKVEIDYDSSQPVKIPKLKLQIVYDDKDCVVINKPVGVLTHSKGAFNPEPTVATWLEDRVKGMGGERAGIVHRLDRATSGVMICAKTPEALGWLQKQFSERKVKKTYAAVIKGVLSESEAVIDMPIERNPRKPQTFRVGTNGKSALTTYKVLKSGNGYSLLELRPATGRTHQLRVHLHKLGHPIVGDELYDGPKAERLFLHAEKLEITLPDKTRQTFDVPVPPSFKELIA
jgi:23S rRNA pseudouridine1911/1915/1917 synthase